MPRKYKFRQNLTKIRDTLQEDLFMLMITFRSVLLRIGNVSDRSRGEKMLIIIIIIIMFNSFFFQKLCLYVIFLYIFIGMLHYISFSNTTCYLHLVLQ